ncbi:MAG: nitrile hydratase subunit beta, partial [Bradyrhizobium sp.]
MDGAHDMGGVAWSGPVRPEPDEPVFHTEWERRAFAITLAMGMPGGWNIDMSRFAREDRPPADYLSRSYYEIWLAGLERLLLERGLVAPEEIAAGRSLHPPKPVRRILTSDGVAAMLHRGGPTEREAARPAQFAVGDTV